MFTKAECKGKISHRRHPKGNKKIFSIDYTADKKPTEQTNQNPPPYNLITLADNTACTHAQVKLKYCAVLIARGVVHRFFLPI